MTVYAVPAITALLVKGVIYLYARFSRVRTVETHLYLLFLFALSIQNLSEIGMFMARADDASAPVGGWIYFAASIAALGLLLHLALVLASGRRTRTRPGLLLMIYAPVVGLEALLWFTPLLVNGFEPFKYTYTKIPGPLYFLFELYVLSYLTGIVALLAYGSVQLGTPSSRLKNRLVLLGLAPMILVVVVVVLLQHYGGASFNTIVTLPVATTVFLIVTAYATHQHRLFDLQFYIPWSKVRKRKTAFYDRIRAMIAEIADLESVNEAVRRLGDTLRCPVALVSSEGVVIATAGESAPMVRMPDDTLRHFEHIAVANEIADAHPDTYAAMQRHQVAAVVPFYPHSRNASGYLLLGKSFSEQVYTPLDFRFVEQLFDKMADLFLDKLLTMRARLASAHKQIQNLERRLQQSEATLAPLQRELAVLRQDNARLLKEQPVDSLAVSQRETAQDGFGATITLLGRDRAMLKHLRAHFPDVAQFVGVGSAGFKRRGLTDVLLCRVEPDATAANRQLRKFLSTTHGETAVMLYGPGAHEFASDYRRDLLGSLVECLPEDISEPALMRKVRALTELRKSVRAIQEPDYPLIGRSQVFSEMLAHAERIAGFEEPVLIRTDDTGEGVALAAYMHARSGRSGQPVRISGTQLKKVFGGTNDSDVNELIAAPRGGTLVIENICALPAALRGELRFALAPASDVRVVATARCDRGELESALRIVPTSQRPFVLDVPGLRERKVDLKPLIHYYTLQFNLQANTHHYLSQSEVDDLLLHDYPADLAALKASVFAALQSKHETAPALPELDYGVTHKSLDEYVAEFETRLIAETLKRCDGNKSKAARLLGLRANTLHYKMERYGLSAAKKRRSA